MLADASIWRHWKWKENEQMCARAFTFEFKLKRHGKQTKRNEEIVGFIIFVLFFTIRRLKIDKNVFLLTSFAKRQHKWWRWWTKSRFDKFVRRDGELCIEMRRRSLFRNVEIHNPWQFFISLLINRMLNAWRHIYRENPLLLLFHLSLFFSLIHAIENVFHSVRGGRKRYEDQLNRDREKVTETFSRRDKWKVEQKKWNCHGMRKRNANRTNATFLFSLPPKWKRKMATKQFFIYFSSFCRFNVFFVLLSRSQQFPSILLPIHAMFGCVVFCCSLNASNKCLTFLFSISVERRKQLKR